MMESRRVLEAQVYFLLAVRPEQEGQPLRFRGPRVLPAATHLETSREPAPACPGRRGSILFVKGPEQHSQGRVLPIPWQACFVVRRQADGANLLDQRSGGREQSQGCFVLLG